MNSFTFRRGWIVPALGWCLSWSAAGVAGEITTLDEAQAAARERGQPILIETRIRGCGSCRRFEKAVKDDANVQQALAGLVLLQVDVEKGDGKRIRKDFGIKVYPTFLLVDADLQLIDRWFGFLETDAWIETTIEARSDLDLMEKKRGLFALTPTSTRAAALARDAFLSGKPIAAVKYYRSAQELDPRKAHRYVFPIFYTMQDAMGLFRPEELAAAADSVLANPHRRPMDVIKVAQGMIGLAESQANPEVMRPYLERAILETEGSENALVEKSRRKLMQVRAKALATAP